MQLFHWKSRNFHINDSHFIVLYSERMKLSNFEQIQVAYHMRN